MLWVAGHSGPETADDSRTHFGVFAPGVTQLFPDGHVIDLHPWEHNEVPVVLGAAFAPEGGDRRAAPDAARRSRFPTARRSGCPRTSRRRKGAYVMRDYGRTRQPGGTVVVQGTTTTANLVKVLPELDRRGLNVKVVAAISPAALPPAVQRSTRRACSRLPTGWTRWRSRTERARLMSRLARRTRSADEYTLSSDFDDRWRTGGTLDEVIEEAHLDPKHILEGIERFVEDREKRLARIGAAL